MPANPPRPPADSITLANGAVVTPAMRLAGATVLYGPRYHHKLPEDLAEAVYRAMAALAPPPAPTALLALEKEWRAEANAIGREREKNASAPGLLWHGEKQGRERALRECADTLAALTNKEPING